MKIFKPFLFIWLTLMSLSAVAAETAEKSLDDKINDAIAPIISPFVNAIFSPLPGSEALLGTAFPLDCAVAGSRGNGLYLLLWLYPV